MSDDTTKMVFQVLTWFETYWPVKSQKNARSWNFWIKWRRRPRNCTSCLARKHKALISTAIALLLSDNVEGWIEIMSLVQILSLQFCVLEQVITLEVVVYFDMTQKLLTGTLMFI